jgi:putative flippase GtrA
MHLAEVARYGLAGVLNTATGSLLFPAVYTLYDDWYVATLIICNLITFGQAYLLSSKFVFRARRIGLRDFVLHNAMYWMLFVVSLVAIPAAKERAGIDPRISFWCFAAISVPLGFIWQKYVVFRRSF